MEDNFHLAKRILEKYHQEHLLSFYDEINNKQKELLLEQILRTDFEQIQTLYKNSFIENQNHQEIISPLPHIDKSNLTNEEKEHFTQIGIDSIKKGEFAVITLSGGQRHKTWSCWS